MAIYYCVIIFPLLDISDSQVVGHFECKYRSFMNNSCFHKNILPLGCGGGQVVSVFAF